jgi:hypothetical protein
MEKTDKFTFRIKYLSAWLVWFGIAVYAAASVVAPFRSNAVSTKSDVWMPLFIYVLIFIAFLEAGISFLIRYYAITKPYRKGIYNPQDKFFRYYVVGMINWSISDSIIIYGNVTHYAFGIIWPYYLFIILGFLLLLFHSPRLSPFKKEIAPELSTSKGIEMADIGNEQPQGF